MNMCECQDISGVVCGKSMSSEEEAQDGMCDTCACQVWKEMTSDVDYDWYHNTKRIRLTKLGEQHACINSER